MKSIMSLLTIDQCSEVLRKKHQTDRFSILNYRLELNGQFLGFCSSHAKLIISAELDRGSIETYSFFVKTTTAKPELNEKFWSVQRIFVKEAFIREKLIPELSKYAVDKITAEMYCADREKFIILEDLSCLGYELCRRACPDLEHARLGVRTLANLHAASISLQENSKESLRTKYENALFETIFTFPNGRDSPCLFSSQVSQLRILAEQLIHTIDSATKTRIINLAVDRIQELVQPSKKHLNVICHGDAWGNNVLYRYDSNGKPTSAILVDFQVVRYSPPVIDIIHFIYSSFPRDFIAVHFKDLTDVYYEALSDYLARKKIVINDVLTKKAFLRSVEDFKEFGVLIRAFYIMTQFPSKTLGVMAESPERYLDAMIYGGTVNFDHAFKVSEAYKNHVIESIGDMFKFYQS